MCKAIFYADIKLDLIVIGKDQFHRERQDAHYRERQDRLDHEADLLLLRASKF
jgi:hypothetical protein